MLAFPAKPGAAMSIFVLVHGAWHGGWCWEKVAPLLQAGGHTVNALDLPGHGADKTPLAELTLDSYVDMVCKFVEAQPEPVILVGHSMGGIVISQAAERLPDRIRTLVYLCAFLLQDGQSLFQVSRSRGESIITRNLTIIENGMAMVVAPEAVREAFYEDCSNEDASKAISRLVPEPLAPSSTPIKVSAEGFGSVRRVYIETLEDKALVPALQREMYLATPCEKVISMKTSHSPFYSAPQDLASHLLSL